MGGNFKCPRPLMQGLIRCPKGAGGEERATQEMNVDPAKATAVQAMLVHKVKELLVVGNTRLRQGREQPKDLAPISHPAASELANHEGVAQHFALVE